MITCRPFMLKKRYGEWPIIIQNLLPNQAHRFAVETSWPSHTQTPAKKSAVALLAELVGLSNVLRTRVGSASIRGVSGGERRRVSLAEAIATQADILCLDNPTNGLDSSTALEFIEMMREYTTQSRSATVMSVYQGSDAMVPLFDKVLVINQGRQIYYGPATEAKPYFESLGHICPSTTTITDYLTSMTTNRVLTKVDPDIQSMPPTRPPELEDAYRASLYHKQTLDEIEAANNVSYSSSFAKRNQFSLPLWRQIFLCSKRQFRVHITNYHDWLIEAACIIIQSLAIGTLFRDQPRETKAFFILACSLFFCTLIPSLQAMAEFANTFATRELVMRQKQYGFYRPMSYALGLALTDMVWKIVAISYNIPQYFLTGFQYDAGKFFTWFFVLYVLHLALSSIFRNTATASRSMSWAMLPVGVIFNIMVLYTGLYIPQPQMQVWLSWIRYLNVGLKSLALKQKLTLLQPMYYTYESVMVNELSDLEYLCSSSDLAPSGPSFTNISNQVCPVAGAITGQVTVSGADHLRVQYSFDISHLWRNAGINIAVFIFFAISTGVSMELYKPPAGKVSTVQYRKRDVATPTKELSSDSEIEKGAIDEQGNNPGVGDFSEDRLNRMATHNGRTLVWKNLSLDIEVGGEQKRLLNDLSGKSLRRLWFILI